MGLCARLLALALLDQPAEAARIIGVRGLAPARWATFFGADGSLSCDGGARRVPKAQVNDDFCDCKDGSDDPGTAACATSPAGRSFFCGNRGFESATVFSSRVNDGVCDCCDGSDEWSAAGAAACANTCAAAAAAASGQGAAARAPDAAALRRGAQQRKLYVQQAQQARATLGSVLDGGVYGSEGAYYGLVGQCFTIKSGVFTYKACPYGNATQSEIRKKTKEWDAGLHEILVGQWEGLGVDESGTHLMKFGGGDMCGDTPRSLTVRVSCGGNVFGDNEILSEKEPTQCQYVMEMRSPAACDAAALAAANLDANGEPLASVEPEAAEEDEVVWHDEL